MATVESPPPRPRRALTADADGKVYGRVVGERVHADGRTFVVVEPIDPPSPLQRLAASLQRLADRGVSLSPRRPSGFVRRAPCGCCTEPSDTPPTDLAGPGFEGG